MVKGVLPALFPDAFLCTAAGPASGPSMGSNSKYLKNRCSSASRCCAVSFPVPEKSKKTTSYNRTVLKNALARKVEYSQSGESFTRNNFRVVKIETKLCAKKCEGLLERFQRAAGTHSIVGHCHRKMKTGHPAWP